MQWSVTLPLRVPPVAVKGNTVQLSMTASFTELHQAVSDKALLTNVLKKADKA